MDDLRDFTRENGSIQVYSSQQDFDVIAKVFPYLVNVNMDTGGGVSNLDFITFVQDQPFFVKGVKMIPLKVNHGGCHCFGFRFGSVVYISDCDSIPDNIRTLIKEDDDDILEYFVIDALYNLNHSHPSHFNFKQALKEIRYFQPKITYLTGMGHDWEHNSGNQMLSQIEDVYVRLSFDGLVFPFTLHE
eukprot:TRINITY_DN1539_c0_g1_i6.p1 TRINITY_DN1539_c0_g1~~TRINITY_DN1539_c0_g1_i6.p1  ORF type:complete len:188 (-),score=29.03 TRINITY_DN1539_c0_g1_i6:281-844(-)